MLENQRHSFICSSPSAAPGCAAMASSPFPNQYPDTSASLSGRPKAFSAAAFSSWCWDRGDPVKPSTVR